MNDENNYRKDFHESIEAILDEDEGVLSGWVLVYETVRQDDQRFLTVVSSDATGERNLTPWTAEGWLNYISSSGMPSMEFDEVEEDDEFEDDDD